MNDQDRWKTPDIEFLNGFPVAFAFRTQPGSRRLVPWILWGRSLKSNQESLSLRISSCMNIRKQSSSDMTPCFSAGMGRDKYMNGLKLDDRWRKVSLLPKSLYKIEPLCIRYTSTETAAGLGTSWPRSSYASLSILSTALSLIPVAIRIRDIEDFHQTKNLFEH